MPVTVELDDDVFEALQRRAEPLVDDLNSLLRREFGLDGSASRPDSRDGARVRRSRQRAARGSILPEAAYEIPILEALVELGGRGATSEVVDLVGEKLAHRLGPRDLEPLSGGDVRWRNRAQFVRLKLVRSGDMKSDSRRGIWEITGAGRKRVERS